MSRFHSLDLPLALHCGVTGVFFRPDDILRAIFAGEFSIHLVGATMILKEGRKAISLADVESAG
jgi:hypothetical protein